MEKINACELSVQGKYEDLEVSLSKPVNIINTFREVVYCFVTIFFSWLYQLSSVTPNAKEVRERVRVMAAVFVGGAGLALMQPISRLGKTKTGYW